MFWTHSPSDLYCIWGQNVCHHSNFPSIAKACCTQETSLMQKRKKAERAWWIELNNKTWFPVCLCTSESLTGSTSCETGGGFLKVLHGSCFWSFIRQCLFRFRWSLLNLRVLFFTRLVCAVCTRSIIEGSSPGGGSSCTRSEVTIIGYPIS